LKSFAGGKEDMSKKSAGLIMYRLRNGGIEVLLVHPGGPFWAGRDEGSWSIPKGEFRDDEEPLDAARREFREEIGFEAAGPLIELKPVKQKGGKTVMAWACRGDLDPALFKSNTFTVEWPPRSGKIAVFPEVDAVQWFPLKVARTKIIQAQEGLLDELASLLKEPRAQR
jgi:predicted NUDIX family NTP pyrophosphohydrolase